MGWSNVYRYKINGVLDTARPVMENMEALASSAGAWISYDIMEGKWAPIINKPGNVVASFTDDNIIGGISLTQKGINELYNSVEVQYPNTDIDDQEDWIVIETPPGELNPNEVENQLSIGYPMVNDPAQAMLLGFIELRQSRLDKVVQFTTDYGYINVTAGDVIDITNTIYGWTNEQFRVVTVQEIEDDSGIRLQMTAIQYDESVYNTDDLLRYSRTNEDGIVGISIIGVPEQPTPTVYNSNTRPRFEISANVPDNVDPNNQVGIAEGVEFWTYKVSDAEYPTWESIDDSTRTYTLYRTIAENSGQVLQPGDQVILDVDDLSVGNYLVKTRVINATSKGDFSPRTNLITFSPTQITNAIEPNTVTVDANANVVAGADMANVVTWSLSSQGPNVAANLISSLGLDPNVVVSEGGWPAGQDYEISVAGFSAANAANIFNTYAGTPDLANGYTGNANSTATFTVWSDKDATFITIDIENMNASMNYKYWETVGNVEATGAMQAYVPLLIDVYYNNIYAYTKTTDWQSSGVSFSFIGVPANVWIILDMYPTYTYDLNQTAYGNVVTANGIWPYNFTGLTDLNLNMIAYK